MTSYYKNKKLNTYLVQFIIFLLLLLSRSNASEQILIDTDSIEKGADSVYSVNQPDSINTETIDSTNISREEFRYADTYRVMLNGKTPKAKTQIEILPFSITLACWGGLFAIQHQLQLNTIWREQTDFKVYEDGIYALYADKAGHIFGTYLVSYLVQESLLLSGFSWDLSAIISTTVGLAYTTYVEILDGYGRGWGFSPSDFYADVVGAGFFIGQHYVPFLQNFTPKFMYFPARWFNSNHRVPHAAFIDDYSSHTLWMTINLYNMLPKSAKKYWPSWLDISFGYAARDLCAAGHDCPNKNAKAFYDKYGTVMVYGNPKYILALDFNLVKLLPDDGTFWNWLKQSLNYFKLPSPAVEFGNETKFYLLYPFPINIGSFRF